MEVTKSNLKAFLPLIEEALAEAHFLAIDTELTGLNSINSEHAFDSLEERYRKLKQGCGKFLIIQFGLSAFCYHSEEKKFTHKDFNFYVFPRPYSRQAPDPCFLCQSSSLDYLIQNGFDFNKLFQEGIPYLTPDQEQKMKELLTEKHKDQCESLASSRNQRPMAVPPDQKPFIDSIHSQIDALLQNDAERVLKLPTCNAFQRKLIYQTVNSKYRKCIDLSSSVNENKETYITVVKASEEERRNLLHGRQIADLDGLDEAVGLRKVLELITQSNKLVVGHNMLLDMMHVINQFYHPLPESLDDFKELLSCKFPHLLDTKTMSSLPPFKEYFNSTALGKLLRQLQDKAFGLPTFEPADGFKGYELSECKEHEAGYDAFITGLCFTGLAKRLAFNAKLSEDFLPTNSRHLRPFINRIYIMRHYDITSLNLKGPDPEPSRDHVFFVTFPREWKTFDLVELFLPYGQVYVSWLTDTSALVGLKNPRNKMDVVKDMVHAESNFYKVKPYSEYVEMEKLYKAPLAWESQSASTPQADPVLPNKRRRSSGSSGSEKHGKRSIDPIPEEEEEEKELSNSSRNSKGSSPSLKKSPRKTVPDGSLLEHRLIPAAYPPPPALPKVQPNQLPFGEPDAKKTKVSAEELPSKSKQPGKIFAEPDTW